MKRSICLALVGFAVSLGCLAAEPFKKENVIEAEATIEAIDPATRLLSLRGPAGPATIIAGPEVKNFAQIEVGDKVLITYIQALAAQITKSKATPTATLDTAVKAAPAGAKPSGAVGQQLSTTVRIDSVDRTMDTVSFTRPDGSPRTIAVESQEGRLFIRTLKKGDLVDVVYTEALAMSVVPKAK